MSPRRPEWLRPDSGSSGFNFTDPPLSPALIAVCSLGADIRSAAQVLRALPDVRCVHFGDLDPTGVGIGRSLAWAVGRESALHVPCFAVAYIDLAQKIADWKEIPERPVFRAHKQAGRAIFQEVMLLDPRLDSEFDVYADPPPPSGDGQEDGG